jgi:hypothetical protein
MRFSEVDDRNNRLEETLAESLGCKEELFEELARRSGARLVLEDGELSDEARRARHGEVGRVGSTTTSPPLNPFATGT